MVGGFAITRISQIHLSLIQTFPFCEKFSKFEGDFDFLKDVDEYFKNVVKDNKNLRKKKKAIEGVGQLRSVLDAPISKKTKKRINVDSFFEKLKEFYQVWLKRKDKNLLFPPHLPCAIDIIPSFNGEYQVIKSTLPGTLQEANKVKMSFSMRIYPAGLASLRSGYFFSTENNFNVEDIIDFLWKKRTYIKFNNEELDMYSLSQEFAEKTIEGLLKEAKPSLGWEDTYSIVDIVKATGLHPLDQSKKEIFLPLLNLRKNVTAEENIGENLSDGNDVILPGKKSIVTYLPSSKSDDDEPDCSGRIVRRWLRNFIELFSIQKSLSTEIDAIILSQEYKYFSSNWITDFGKLLKSKDIMRLFSLWFYTTLHRRNGTFKTRKWKERYKKILKVLDRDNTIQTSYDEVLRQMAILRKEAREAETRVGGRIITFIDRLTKGLDVLPW